MLSEAEMEMGNLSDARLYLNQVRARAQTNLVTDAMSPDQITLRGIIHDERARELCFEGLRKFDLIRWGEFYSAMMIAKAGINASTSANKARYLTAYNNFTLRDTLLPIPSSEISVNNQMTQNAGW
jgi:hypothetical protein